LKITSSSRLYKFAMLYRSKADGPIDTGCELIGYAFLSTLVMLASYVVAPALLFSLIGALATTIVEVPLRGSLAEDFIIILPLGMAVSAAASAVFAAVWWIASRLCKKIEIQIDPVPDATPEA
jgi:hypothetical protein